MEIEDNELHEALLGVILLLGDLRAKGLRHFLMKMKRGYPMGSEENLVECWIMIC